MTDKPLDTGVTVVHHDARGKCVSVISVFMDSVDMCVGLVLVFKQTKPDWLSYVSNWSKGAYRGRLMPGFLSVVRV